jgi:hypothetical protein
MRKEGANGFHTLTSLAEHFHMDSRHRIAIMQPYFLPYLGYFQLMSKVDAFVIHDAVDFTKKSWITRNRWVRQKEIIWMNLPVERPPLGTPIREVQLREMRSWSKQWLMQCQHQYGKAPFYKETKPLIEEIAGLSASSLSNWLVDSLILVANHLHLDTEIVRTDATMLAIEQQVRLHPQDVVRRHERVFEITRHFGASSYINPPGGRGLYDQERFTGRGLELQFLQPNLGGRLHELPENERSASILHLLMHLGQRTVIASLNSPEPSV